MNKKALVLLSALCLGATVGCGNNNSTSTNNGGNTSTPAPTAVEYNFALGYAASFKDHYGTMQAEVNVIGVAFDKEGKILDSRIDVVQINTAVVEGAPVMAEENPASKLELGTDYKMAGVSAIGKEVYLQIEAYNDWLKGKTVADVKAATGEDGKVADLASSCSIVTGSFLAALEDAAAHKNADTYTVSSLDDLNTGVGIYVGLYGANEVTAYIAAATTTDAGVVTAAAIDNVVFMLAVGEDGKVCIAEKDGYGDPNKYTGANGEFVSKKHLGEKYAMKGTSAQIGTIEGGAEWDEQAVAYEKGIVGKTATEIAALEKGSITGNTITIDDINKSAAEAAKYATMDVITSKPQA